MLCQRAGKGRRHKCCCVSAREYCVCFMCARKKANKGTQCGCCFVCEREPTRGSGAGAAVRAMDTVRIGNAMGTVLEKNASQGRRWCVSRLCCCVYETARCRVCSGAHTGSQSNYRCVYKRASKGRRRRMHARAPEHAQFKGRQNFQSFLRDASGASVHVRAPLIEGGAGSASRGGDTRVLSDVGAHGGMSVGCGGLSVDCGGLRWTAVDCGGLWWTAVDCGGLRWTAVDCGGLWWTGGCAAERLSDMYFR